VALVHWVKGRWPGGASLHLHPSVGGQAMAVRGAMALGAAVAWLGVQRKGKTLSGLPWAEWAALAEDSG
jgi:hypothetical protein